VSPNEIEEVLAEVPGLRHAVVVGIPDPVLGHRLVAALSGNGAPDESLVEAVRRHCRMQLPAYMVPAEFQLLAELPLTPNGKPDRRALAVLLSGGGSGAD
jgi:acyl-CoA synthetase (AMP-forming)/AMP-acid ligase II